MALWGIIAFIIYGWVEFEAMAHIVDGIGGLLAFIGIFVTAGIGIHLLRSQSAIVMAKFRADMAKGHVNSKAIASSVSLLAGAILMLIPGYVTDSIGFLCFVPGIREIIGTFIAKRFSAGMMAQSARFTQGGFGKAGFKDGFSGFQNATESDMSSSDPFSETAQQKTKPHLASDNDIIEGEFKDKT